MSEEARVDGVVLFGPMTTCLPQRYFIYRAKNVSFILFLSRVQIFVPNSFHLGCHYERVQGVLGSRKHLPVRLSNDRALPSLTLKDTF